MRFSFFGSFSESALSNSLSSASSLSFSLLFSCACRCNSDSRASKLYISPSGSAMVCDGFMFLSGLVGFLRRCGGALLAGCKFFGRGFCFGGPPLQGVVFFQQGFTGPRPDYAEPQMLIGAS